MAPVFQVFGVFSWILNAIYSQHGYCPAILQQELFMYHVLVHFSRVIFSL
jgi:hypothetical protein